ncbi:MAG: twin-arginine translocase subunit TatC [Marinilabiliales bacterium]
MDTNSSEKEKNFTDHLEDLRKIIIRIIIAVIAFTIIAFFLKHIIFDYILFAPTKPCFITNCWLCKLGIYMDIPSLCINNIEISLVNMELAGQFRAHIYISVIAGVIFAFPFMIYQIWKFVEPAFKSKEKAIAVKLILSTSLLFFFGIFFGYFIITPLAINFLSNYQVSKSLTDLFNFQNYLSIVSGIVLSTGIIFELPVLVYFLSKMQILTHIKMRKFRKQVIVLIMIISGIITPPDAFSMILVAIPLYLLYEISISISKRIYIKQQKKFAG